MYVALAEVLSSTTRDTLPSWINAPGKEWPLFAPVAQLAHQLADPALGQAVVMMAEVSSSSAKKRRQEYERLFMGESAPPIWLYESHFTNGRIPGPATFAVKGIYTQAGLEVNGCELPDHASIELGFLAHLAHMEVADCAQAGVWRASRQLFIKNHAGRWLPHVGKQLTRSKYPAWVAIGQTLSAVLQINAHKGSSGAHPALLHISEPHACNLCGFCVQVCPMQALFIREDDHLTALWLQPDLCVCCKKCEQVCTEGALSFTGEANRSKHTLLKESPRARCPACGDPTISQAEFDAVARQLDRPSWLAYCLGCRVSFVNRD